MAGRFATVALVGLALVALGCIGPLADLGDPPKPQDVVACCQGYDRARMGSLVDAAVTESGHDELALPADGFRVRVEAVAVSRGVRAGATKAAGLGDSTPMPNAVDAEHELLSALLSVTADNPVEHIRGDGHWQAFATVTVIRTPADGNEVSLYFSEKKKPKGTVIVVLMAVVPVGSTVVMCADDETDEQPWLNLRTGRYEPKPADALDCGDRRVRPSPPLRSGR